MYGFEVDLKSLKQALVFGVSKDRLMISDIQHIPVRDEAFDFVICWHVIEHVPNPEKAIEEINRVLRPNGILVLGVPHEKTVTNLVFRPFRWLCRRGINNYYVRALAFYSPTHLREYTRSSLVSLLEKDFRIMKVRLDTFDLPIFRILGPLLPPETRTLRHISTRMPYVLRRSLSVCAKRRNSTKDLRQTNAS
jgi:SAM-dependent methyltransferase